MESPNCVAGLLRHPNRMERSFRPDRFELQYLPTIKCIWHLKLELLGPKRWIGLPANRAQCSKSLIHCQRESRLIDA
jgi:hypothetical protein